MDLQAELDKSGYTRAAQEVAEAKVACEFARKNLGSLRPGVSLPKVLADLAEFEIWIKNAEKQLAEDYAEVVKKVDAHNDLDFKMLDIMETAELVLEYVEEDLPDHPNTAKIRKVVEAMRKGEKYEPDEEIDHEER
jgi:hypothetical protein